MATGGMMGYVMGNNNSNNYNNGFPFGNTNFGGSRFQQTMLR